MGTYTTNYGLLKAGDGTIDPSDDFVDVVGQLDRNLTLVDDIAHRACNYAYFENVRQSNLPTIGNRAGDKIYSNYDSSVKVWKSTGVWVNTKSAAPVWTDAPYNSGYDVIAGDDIPSYYTDSAGTVFMRGFIIKTGYAIWAQGTSNAVFPAGSFPAPTASRTLTSIGGFSTSRQAQMYYIVINTDGSATITKYGPNAQTAANTENYVSLGGMSYALS